MHLFRELLVGAYLRLNGHKAVYEREVAGKTPDWCVVKRDDRPEAIVEVMTFHIDQRTDDDIWETWKSRPTWCGFLGNNSPRLYSKMHSKFSKYASLAEEEHLPYVLSLHGDFFADVEAKEIEECLLSGDTGLLALYPAVSGFLYFEIQGGTYIFKYTANPHAISPFYIPDGVF